MPIRQLVPVPEFMTKPVENPKLPEIVTCGYVRDELIPILYSKLEQCNMQLDQVDKLKLEENK